MRFHNRNSGASTTSEQTHPHYARHDVPPDYTPRLRLKPKAERGGYIDGAWWPRSSELTAELPDLLAVLTVRLGPIWRVVYDPTCWSDTPRQTTVHGGQIVRLDSYPFELWNTMYVFGRDNDLLVLRVIPSATDDDIAHTALMAAVAPEAATTPTG
ncbi:hypothetical protein IU479_14720 [Nocardia abscessus]|uniref:DUF5994 family protein n=1 Tax=Nocardia TaxID=1817 RepID=UPI001892D4DC|nr:MULTISPECIES: DUF5994 family protein [Nocardia]MBF6219365.1 hypothetical protein [Nocardia abscessus]MDE1669259.1 DUF5994 family protein [Nocardia gipuzkoensis]